MKLYVVRNKEGKFFRNIGYGGHGGNWQQTIDKAKFYTKIGQAKSRVTYFFREYPKFGCPEILEFDISVENAIVLDMEEITKKSIEKIENKKTQRKIASQEWQRKSAEEEIERLRQFLKKI